MEVLTFAAIALVLWYLVHDTSNADAPSIVLSPDVIYMPVSSQQLAQAIAKAEGYGVPNAIPTVANNPGDLKLGDVGYGTMGTGITVFASADDGWSALYHQCDLMLTGRSAVYSLDWSLAQVGSKYANGDPNWAINVAFALTTLGYIGVTTDTTLSQLAQG